MCVRVAFFVTQDILQSTARNKKLEKEDKKVQANGLRSLPSEKGYDSMSSFFSAITNLADLKIIISGIYFQ